MTTWYSRFTPTDMLSDCLPLSSYAMSIHYEVYCRDMHTEGSRKLFLGVLLRNYAQ